MKRLSLSIIVVALPLLCGQAQIKAPVQYDTLAIMTMQYHFDDIRPENWPFMYVVRTASSFIFGDQEFKIKDSSDYITIKEFVLDYGNGQRETLTLEDKKDFLKLAFDGYILTCSNPKSSVNSQKSSAKSNAHLLGRTVLGSVPKVSYNAQANGTVVVTIWVDQYGTVQKAIAGADGTTLTDKNLWMAAREAALITHFSMNNDAPALQEGYITYCFDVEQAVPYKDVEQKPLFNGGEVEEFSKWVNQRLVYPEIAKENGIQGRINAQFTIGKDGKVTDVKIIRGVDLALDSEVIRVISMSPEWTPGAIAGKPVAVILTFPVYFSLQ